MTKSHRHIVDTAEIVRAFNQALAAPDNRIYHGPSAQSYRRGMASALEHLLHATGEYAGFTYQASEFKPTADQTTGESPLRENYDDSRRRYLTKP